MSDPTVQRFCGNGHSMHRGADWCSECGLPPAEDRTGVPTRAPMDSTGRPIYVGDRVSWRGEIYTIRGFGEAVGRCGTRAIEFEEPLHVEEEIPDEIGVDLVDPPTRARRCRWCGDGCPSWGEDTCPLRPRQLPRGAEDPLPADTCVACGCVLGAARTTVRRPDGSVRFVMCDDCFEHRFCSGCLTYFPNVAGRQEHRCPN